MPTWENYNTRRPQFNAPAPSPQPMTYGAPPLPQPQGPGMVPMPRPAAPAPSFGRSLPGAGATPASPNYGRTPAPTAAPMRRSYAGPAQAAASRLGRAPAPLGQDPMAAQQMLARGRGNAMPQTTSAPTSALPNPQRAAGSGAGRQVAMVGGNMFYR